VEASEISSWKELRAFLVELAKTTGKDGKFIYLGYARTVFVVRSDL